MFSHCASGALPRRARTWRAWLVITAALLCVAGTGYALRAGRARASGNPLRSLSPPAAVRAEGLVIERLHAGSYTYLALKTADSDEPRWVVTMGRGVPPNTRVRVRSFGTQRDFHSRRLQRSFPELSFGIVTETDGEAHD